MIAKPYSLQYPLAGSITRSTPPRLAPELHSLLPMLNTSFPFLGTQTGVEPVPRAAPPRRAQPAYFASCNMIVFFEHLSMAEEAGYRTSRLWRDTPPLIHARSKLLRVNFATPNPSFANAHLFGFASSPSTKQKGRHTAGSFVWRKERDSNPRCHC